MKIKSSKEKGKRFEKFICHQIEEMGLGKSTRTPGSGSGKLKADIFSNLDFSLECKNEVQTNFLPNIDQTKKEAEQGNWSKEKWALITRDPRFPEFQEVYATIDLWQFLELLKKGSEPLIKEPDKDLKWKLQSLKQICQSIIKRLE